MYWVTVDRVHQADRKSSLIYLQFMLSSALAAVQWPLSSPSTFEGNLISRVSSCMVDSLLSVGDFALVFAFATDRCSRNNSNRSRFLSNKYEMEQLGLMLYFE